MTLSLSRLHTVALHLRCLHTKFMYCTTGGYSLLSSHTVPKNDIIVRSIERMLQTQLSMARKFPLWRLRRYSVKFLKCVILHSTRHGRRKLNNTSWARTNILCCSPPLLPLRHAFMRNKRIFIISRLLFC